MHVLYLNSLEVPTPKVGICYIPYIMYIQSGYASPSCAVLPILCLKDCEVIGWAELCERKKLTAGSCFQLKWLGHRGAGLKHAMVAVAGWLKELFLFHVADAF